MTPGNVRDELVVIQAHIREIEQVIERQKSANVGYHAILHEMTEGWEALDRAIEDLDEIAMGAT